MQASLVLLLTHLFDHAVGYITLCQVDNSFHESLIHRLLIVLCSFGILHPEKLRLKPLDAPAAWSHLFSKIIIKLHYNTKFASESLPKGCGSAWAELP